LSRAIVSLPGDGIGKTVLPEAIRVLDSAGFEADYIHADIGWEFWCKEGNAFPHRTIELLEENKIGLFGAITKMPLLTNLIRLYKIKVLYISVLLLA